MVGGVKTRTFEYDAYGLVNLLQSLLRALWAASERRIAKFLLLIKLHAAVGATVGVDWHRITSQIHRNGLLPT